MKAGNQSIWTDDLVERLTALWAVGRSASEIASAILRDTGICLTRNAVIGKARRMNLQFRGNGGNYNGNGRPKPAPKRNRPNAGAVIQHLRRSPPKIRPDLQVVAEPPNTGLRMLSVLELTDQTCKYGIGDVGEPGFGFCGHPTVPGKPYCAGHCKVAFVPLPERKSAKALRRNREPRFGGRAA